MKKYKSIAKAVLLSCTLALTTSCNDFLDKAPDDQLTMEMIFTDKIRTEDWLAGVYSSIPSPMWGYFKAQGYNIMGDDITIPQDWSPYGWSNVYAYTTGNWSPISTWDPYYWVELHKRIRSGLIFLQEAKVLPEKDLKESYVNQMKYEVRFLIAYYYSLMIELYGAIPFTPGVLVSVDAPESEMMTPQRPYAEVVDWIDKELLEVSEHLPAVYPNNTDWGRATSIMALAIRAKTLLFAASPLFNGNPDLKDWKNSEGEFLFDAEAKPERWEKAAKAHLDLIKAAEAAGHKLYYEYNVDGSIDPFMSYYNMSLKRFSEGNKEILFGRPENVDLNYWQAHHLPKGIGGNAAMGVTQELVDAFYMKNGEMPILGYNYGAKNKDRLMKTYKEAFKVALIVMAAGTLLFQAIPAQLLLIFDASEEMLRIGVPALRLISLCFIPAAFGIITGTLFQGTGHGVLSLYASVIRQLVGILPLAYLLIKIGGVTLSWLAFPLAEILGLIYSAIMLRWLYKKEISKL